MASKIIERKVISLDESQAKMAAAGWGKEALEKTLAQIQKISQAKAKIYSCDVSDPKQVKTTIEQIKADFGRIDILINNAAIWWQGELEEHSDEKLQELFNINTLGYIYTIKYVLPTMKQQKSGQILNVVSIAGVDYEAGWAPYVATKHAVRAFIESVRKEYAKYNIKVMGIYPPGMATEIFESAGFHYGRADWMTDPKDIAEIILFMLSQPKDIVLNHVEIRKLGWN